MWVFLRSEPKLQSAVQPLRCVDSCIAAPRLLRLLLPILRHIKIRLSSVPSCDE